MSQSAFPRNELDARRSSSERTAASLATLVKDLASVKDRLTAIEANVESQGDTQKSHGVLLEKVLAVVNEFERVEVTEDKPKEPTKDLKPTEKKVKRAREQTKNLRDPRKGNLGLSKDRLDPPTCIIACAAYTLSAIDKIEYKTIDGSKVAHSTLGLSRTRESGCKMFIERLNTLSDALFDARTEEGKVLVAMTKLFKQARKQGTHRTVLNLPYKGSGVVVTITNNKKDPMHGVVRLCFVLPFKAHRDQMSDWYFKLVSSKKADIKKYFEEGEPEILVREDMPPKLAGPNITTSPKQGELPL